MKKNVLMRAASGLLVATMLTTCAISGTFAKYVTQDNGGDIARVAKWGVVVQVEGDLYGQKYLNKEGGNLATDKLDSDAEIGINGIQHASPTSNVVAPGSKSVSGLAFNINGKPEVDTKTTVKINAQNIYLAKGTYGVMVPVADGILNSENFDNIANASGADAGLYTRDDSTGIYTKVTGVTPDTTPSGTYYTLEDYVVNANTYYPVTYTLHGEDTSTIDPDITTNGPTVKNTDTLQAIADTILGQISSAGVGGTPASWTYDAGAYSATAVSGVVENNQDLRNVFKLKDTVLTWNWEFNDTKDEDQVHDGIDHHISQQDKLDTILGNLMAKRVDGTNAGTATADFRGEVVKFVDASSTYKAPTEATGTELHDYCLDTKFDICITVEQVD